MSSKQYKKRSKSENEAGSLWEQFQLNSTENSNGDLNQFRTEAQNKKEADSLWEQFQLNNATVLNDVNNKTENIAQKIDEDVIKLIKIDMMILLINW